VQVRIAPEYPSRFGDCLAHLGVGGNDRIMLAVSGGPDSLALLLLAHQHAADRIVAATIDHQLRPESAHEAAYVGEICNQLAVPHRILTPAQALTGNIQSSARAARYGLLASAADDSQCRLIATAHHADDQLETLMMRLMRGSGIDGLAAIRARNGRIIRPLLGFSKLELEKICAYCEVNPVRDPSNDDSDFDRVAVRHWLAESSHPFQLSRIKRTVRALGEAADALAWAVDNLVAQRIAHENYKIQCDSTNLPREMQRRLLLHCLSRLDPDLRPRGAAIDHLLTELEAGKTAMIGNILCEGGSNWQFSAAPPRRTDL
jgi:tRNA(Ile)-lysidine synthase